jgi:hypothetical protein
MTSVAAVLSSVSSGNRSTYVPIMYQYDAQPVARYMSEVMQSLDTSTSW